MKSHLIKLLKGYTLKEYQFLEKTMNLLWESNKKLMLQNQDLHNRLQVEKIQPTKKKKGRPPGSKNKKKI